ncbi:MAG TPA: hypothetical protein VGG40_10170 [Solirubrobacterales bacterium]|jgi:hypothetical protein
MSALVRTTEQLGDLAALALDTLPHTYLPDSGLFAHKTTVESGSYVNQGPNVLYSSDSLIGILSQRRRSPDEVMDLGPAMDGAVRAAQRRNSPDELANMVWACTLAEDPRGEDLLRALCEVEPTAGSGGNLGLVLYGLVAGARAYENRRDAAIAKAREVKDEICGRFSPQADVFTGARKRQGMPRRELLEYGIASFASQVYPLHGLAAYYIFTGESPDPAVERVARRIVDVQGPLGQWWWIYSTRERVVIEGYPVYSVHQDGMAFLGLMELERLGIGGFREALALGVDWELGANELSTSLVSTEPSSIARCIQRRGSQADGIYGVSQLNFARMFARSLAPKLSGDHVTAAPQSLEMLLECRSYHLGWLLYADSLVQAALERQPA